MAKPRQITSVRFRADSDGCLSGPAFTGAVIAQYKKEPSAAVLLVDLDELHALNESAGREAGDKVIAGAIGVLAKTAQREGWTLGRMGGDEFALLAPGVALEQAFLRGERLREELVAASAKAFPGDRHPTASIGVAAMPRDAKTPEELMRKAEGALYAAKEQGGDAVALPPSADMVLKSSYYATAQLGRLKALAERLKKKEAVLLREALDDLLRKHDRS